MAIAITLLVLDLKVPTYADAAAGGLAAALGRQWPSYAAYLVSFLVVGIIWINHHAMFTQVRRVDRGVLFANLGLLLVISVIPFPTRLLAEYLTAGLADGRDAHVAAAVYSATMLGIAVAFTGLGWAVTRDAGLLHEHLDRAASRAALRRFGLGLVVYGGCVGLAFVNAYATLAVHGALALYYCFDQLRTTAATAPEAG
jgi:TMEM175 potassium channel family protein